MSNTLHLAHAAVIAEMEDGTSMLFELTGPISLTLAPSDVAETSYPDEPRTRRSLPLTARQTLTVEGNFVDSEIWLDDVPRTHKPATIP